MCVALFYRSFMIISQRIRLFSHYEFAVEQIFPFTEDLLSFRSILPLSHQLVVEVW